MSDNFLRKHFDLEGQVAVVTGGSGVLGGAMAKGLAQAGARVAILARREEQAVQAVASITEVGGEGHFVLADVLNRAQLEAAKDNILGRWGRVDILVNGAGGNLPAATIAEDASFFDMPQDAFEQVVSLNLTGSLLPSQVFGRAMVERRDGARGCIINISSMAAIRAISRVVGYSVAKAAIDNLTRWLAVELARKYGAGLRVNAIAPGFFIGEQNRRLLTNPDGSLTPRGQKIIEHTPAGRFGEPDELVSTLLFLCGPGSTFINGVVVPVDGGFNIFSGV
jgi:NAD(P)-dependent dehydrogenase (short-subunit alcohol dehydrogenase family)